MSARVVPASLTFAVIVSLGCATLQSIPLASSGNQAGPSGGSDLPADLAWIFEPNSNTIDLTLTLATERSVEAAVPVEGGSLTATGPDGTTYTLQIPADALRSGTLIRMTPVTSIDGLPFDAAGGLAVHLEPEGLTLDDFAILTIVPADSIEVGQQILFGFQEGGAALSLALPVVDSQEIQIRVLHFSGYGVTKGFLADVGPVRERLGGDVEARLESALAESLQFERQRQLLGAGESGSADVEGFGSALQEYIERVVKPRLAAAGDSCAAAQLAGQTILSLSRKAQLLGTLDITEQIPGAASLGETAASICMKEEYELCTDDHVVHRIHPVYIGLRRIAAQTGVLAEGQPDPAFLHEAEQYVEQCLRFDLVFESTADTSSFLSRVKATVPLHFTFSAGWESNAAPLVNEEFDFEGGEGCTTLSTRGGGTWDYARPEWIVDPPTKTDPLGHVRDIRLAFFPGQTSEAFTVSCSTISQSFPPSPLWTGMFVAAHQGDMSSEGGFVMTDWEIFGNEYFAKREWQKEKADVELVEIGTFKLYHRPGGD